MTHPTPQLANIGDTLPPLTFGPISRQTLALYAGASGDHNPIHIDTDFATAAGLDDVITHGMLAMSQLGRLVSDWVGSENIATLSTRFTAIIPVGASLTCTACVIECFEQDATSYLRLRLAAHINDGTQALKGDATVRVP
ncbi:MaoC/PaaZ C-terminal domain-containing protein [Shimia abyssi]|uniref:Acyl dehydratase n=1 Tax=Shimia abyssi TaxID=1662395 RepID=A0A2P8F7K4_9RHOB|nr:MaoC/PaaZ C-terminal domain-containing protein [Shimia abyssi]PSL17705.1 acyl dehydratase [Shimia abyssi]